MRRIICVAVMIIGAIFATVLSGGFMFIGNIVNIINMIFSHNIITWSLFIDILMIILSVPVWLVLLALFGVVGVTILNEF